MKKFKSWWQQVGENAREIAKTTKCSYDDAFQIAQNKTPKFDEGAERRAVEIANQREMLSRAEFIQRKREATEKFHQEVQKLVKGGMDYTYAFNLCGKNFPQFANMNDPLIGDQCAQLLGLGDGSNPEESLAAFKGNGSKFSPVNHAAIHAALVKHIVNRDSVTEATARKRIADAHPMLANAVALSSPDVANNSDSDSQRAGAAVESNRGQSQRPAPTKSYSIGQAAAWGLSTNGNQREVAAAADAVASSNMRDIYGDVCDALIKFWMKESNLSEDAATSFIETRHPMLASYGR